MEIILPLGYFVIAICALLFGIRYGKEDGLDTFMLSMFWPFILFGIIVWAFVCGVDTGTEFLIKKYRKR